MSRHDFVIVEGAGGLLSPLSRELNSLTLALRLELPLLIVVENRIGALNQALLTIKFAQASGAKVTGIVFNQCRKLPYGRIEKTNPLLFKQLSRVPVWAVIPFVTSKSGNIQWKAVGNHLKKGLARLNDPLKSL